jgi:arylsulfatase A-like enzyme
VNILFITLDQFRSDSFGAAGHPLVKTPALDRLAREGVRLANHYSQAAPCSPGRAALYTGTYQMNNRVVSNGTPHPSHLENIATVARRAGYDPTLFGYTDQGVDPRVAAGADDPRLDDYDGILPGFSVGCYLPNSQAPWVHWLRSLGHDVSMGWQHALASEPQRHEDVSLSAFLSDRFIEWLGRQDDGWFAHLSFLRPHPPYAAAGKYSSLYDPADVTMPITPVDAAQRHSLHEIFINFEASAAAVSEEGLRDMRAQYYGMISEVDAQLERVFDAIDQRDEWDNTLIVVTSDHGEQLGDHGLKEKEGFFPQSYQIVGLWRDPRNQHSGSVIEQYTENVDLLPTLCDAMGIEIPASCDGRSLGELLDGNIVNDWRRAAHYEWDLRFAFIPYVSSLSGDRPLENYNLAVGVQRDIAYVQFSDGTYLCFDLALDPTWRTPCSDDARIFDAAREMLVWRQQHMNRELTDLLLSKKRPGRWPQLV